MADFIINPDLLIENFENGALLLNKKTREMIDVSSDENWLLSQVEKKNGRDKIIKSFSRKNGALRKKNNIHVDNIYRDLINKNVLVDHGEFMKKKYVQNPVVNLREEDDDGALLFNPDSNRIRLLNNTGFFIWKLCASEKSLDELADAVRQEYIDAPKEQLDEDMKNFLDEMVGIGFIDMVKKAPQGT
jgi:hypothetical protein